MQKIFNLILSVRERFNSNIVFDSRQIRKNDIFIALKTKNNDGSLFFQEALNKGSKLILVNNPNAIHENIIQIKDINNFISKFCKFILSKYKGKIIAISGSVGKTTIKENIYNILSNSNYFVFKSYKNFNNELGLKFSIMNLNLKSNFSIFELGINAPNEMITLIKLLKPNYCLITGIEDSHIGNFKNFNHLVKNKIQIFDSKNLIKGLINFSYKIPDLRKSIKSNVQLLNINDLKTSVTKKNHYQIDFNFSNKKHSLISEENGIYIETAILSYIFLNKFIKKFKSKKFFFKKSIINSRGKIINKIYNGNKIKIFDNSYNASPYALKKQLFFFDKKKLSKKLCIIGSMKELGTKSSFYHQEIIDMIRIYKFDKSIFIGNEFYKFKNSFKNYKFYKSYIDYNRVMNKDFNYFKNIFIMGSRLNKLEKIIEKI